MDWERILSVAPEELTGDDIDDLYSSVAWYDFDNEEELDISKCISVIKLSQEIMKFKSGQVQTLLTELDELQGKHGEEAKKSEHETDGRSSRSKKSTLSLDYDDVEQKYVKLKNKYKQQGIAVDKQKKTIEELKAKIELLENEKEQLQYELQTVHQDGSQSDISEAVREKQKELLDSLHYKNKQISNLLADIEEIEKENIFLREKLTALRDELSEATVQITGLCENIALEKEKNGILKENINSLAKENEDLRLEIQTFNEEKLDYEKKINEVSEELNFKIEFLKKTIEQREDEIKQLKSLIPTSKKSSPKTETIIEKPKTPNLKEVIDQQATQIADLQMQLHSATIEMEETTETVKKLTYERDSANSKIQHLNSLCDDVKKQLDLALRRCKELQEDVQFVEKKYREKEKEVKKWMADLKEDGMIEVSEVLLNLEEAKAKNSIQEKKIIELVKTTNKLQICWDTLELENDALRDKLGMTPSESINLNGVLLKQRRQKKEIQKLEKRLDDAEHQILDYKNKIQKKNRIVANLSDQLEKLGVKPEITNISDEFSSKTADMMALCEENDALRKGLHEILDSVNKKRESSLKEVNSKVLEKLLRALDVRHVAGWYHPAMRLQAEVHTLQGNNAELREQLRLQRIELIDLKQQKLVVTDEKCLSDDDAASNKTYTIEKDQPDRVQELEDGELTQNTEKPCKTPKDQDNTEETLNNEHKILEEKLLNLQEKNSELEEKLALTETKLKEFLAHTLFGSDELAKIQHTTELAQNNVILNRKCVFLESKDSELRKIINQLEHDLIEEESSKVKQVSLLSKTEKQLRNELEMLKTLHTDCVDKQIHLEVQKNLDRICFKYRETLQKFTDMCNDNSNEMIVLKQTVENLKAEKAELEVKLVDAFTKIRGSEENKEDATSKKIAQCEVALFTEKQRANHMNNLYELVKDQLQKSEERFSEFEKYHKEVAHRNLILQENLNDVQDKISDYIEARLYKEIQDKCAELLEENSKLKTSVEELKETNKLIVNTRKIEDFWSEAREYEFISLKHQIVDLQAASDDKTVIARLSSDVVRARLTEASCQRKLDMLKEEMDEMRELYQKSESLRLKEKEAKEGLVVQLEDKLKTLKSLLKSQRLQYSGCVPLLVEEAYVEKLEKASEDKKAAFKSLRDAQISEREILQLKEELQLRIKQPQEIVELIKTDANLKALADWHKDKFAMQLTELKLKRQLEFKEDQLQQVLLRVNNQENELLRLEEELLHSYQRPDDPYPPTKQEPLEVLEKNELEVLPLIKLYSSQETQTLEVPQDSTEQDEKIRNLQMELLASKNESAAKDNNVEQLKTRIKELEMDVNLFRKQIGDKQSQITFYEKHILELQSKKEGRYSSEGAEGGGDGHQITEVFVDNSEIVALKEQLNSMQAIIKEKEEYILKFQALLKQDRDEHSLAAARMQEEHKKVQAALLEQQKAYCALKESHQAHPGKAAIEQYVHQVHELEKHTAELHTNVTSLNSQLQASREEAVRWRSLANDRLQSMEQLRKDLGEQHQKELASYRYEAQKWRQEVTNLNTLLVKLKSEIEETEPDSIKLLKEKDDKIHELTVMLRQTKGEAKRLEKDKGDVLISPKINELELVKEQLSKELETLKRRNEQLVNRERNAREEIRNLKGQLMRRPALSARSDKTDKSTKDQLLKKISTLEKENNELKATLNHHIQLNETHREKIAEDFDKWKKQKHWQQTAERLKAKLKERDDEYEKLQQTCNGYRLLIERLEREKHGWESKVKNMKGVNPAVYGAQAENIKLKAELEELRTKLGMQQYHAGALGAAMLQEKLEAQERKIAVLELSAKGTTEIRSEMERLHATSSNLQKRNLCLEAENLDLRLDLEKSINEVPYLKEQIQHLESYVEALKAENVTIRPDNDRNCQEKQTADEKKVAELEKTVFVLKRVVEKLKAENKRLNNGRSCTLQDRSVPADKLRTDLTRLRQKYGDSVQKIARLEQELEAANAKIKTLQMKAATTDSDELSIKDELEHKTILLDKVKMLLQRAAVKEKAMLDEIAILRERLRGSESNSAMD